MEFQTFNYILLHLLTICYVVRTRMLKLTECGIYDAEFSVFKRNHRFKANITKIIQVNATHECPQGCTVYPDCFSYNFHRDNKTCEFVNVTTIGFKSNMENLESIDGWTYYETKDKKALGPWCERYDPCIINRCEDRCNGHECVKLPVTTQPICFGARGRSPALFTVPKNGPITTIKLLHVSGYVTCSIGRVDTNWGCNTRDIDTHITDENNVLIFPFRVRSVYRLAGVDKDTKELTLTSPDTGGYQAMEGEILKIWYGEDWANAGTGDNGGTSCVKVFLHYATT